MAEAIKRATPGKARIWALTGHRAGDNAQVLALADMLRGRVDAEIVEKRLAWSSVRWLPNLLLPPTVAVLSEEARRQIAPPWPALVIGVGRRAVPVARWIASRRDHGCPLVWLGRPRAPLDWFDLVLTTAQYGLPQRENVILLDLPPALPAAADDAYLARWRETFADLPRPLTAVLVGGPRWPLLFDATAARRLGEDVMAEMARSGGAWVVSTSPRTGIRQARALHESLRRPGYFYYWRDDRAAHDNPHRALLALADRFIVTADSATMIAEAVRSGRPVRLWPMRQSALAVHWRADRGVARWLAEEGLLSPPRDMRAFCDRLVQRGLASWVGDAEIPRPATWRESALEEAIGRIAGMLAA